MADQSHRDEMNAAIRAQRERHAVPRSIAPEPEARHEPEPAVDPPPEPEPAGKSLVARLLGR